MRRIDLLLGTSAFAHVSLEMARQWLLGEIRPDITTKVPL